MAANHIEKKNPTDFFFINATRCRHNHKTRYELNVSKNDLFTDSVNMNIHTSLNKFIFFLPNFIFQKAIYTSCILFVFIFCYMLIKLFVVKCSLCSIPFLLRDCKVLCCICGGNNLESNTRKLRTHIYWNNQITYTPPQYACVCVCASVR